LCSKYTSNGVRLIDLKKEE
jgi:hypothetical protein